MKYQFPTYSYPAFRDMTVFMSSGGMGNMVGIDPGMAAWNNSVFPPVPIEEYVRDRLEATSLADEIAARMPAVLVEQGSTLTGSLDDDALARAVAIAERADIVVLALGGASLWFNGERTEGEASDSADISLPLAQQKLAEAVAATGTPMVAVLVQGRPYVLPTGRAGCRCHRDRALRRPVRAGGGRRCALRHSRTTGKLPYSIPRHTGQIPVYHHQHAGTGYRNPLPPDVDRHYLDLEATPLYTFGHGLSYTEFAITDPAADSEFATDGAARIAFTLTNVGERAGETVAQLYNRGHIRPESPDPPSSWRASAAWNWPQENRVACRSPSTPRNSGTRTSRASSPWIPVLIEWHVGLDADDKAAAGTLRLTGASRPLSSADRTFLSEIVNRMSEQSVAAPAPLDRDTRQRRGPSDHLRAFIPIRRSAGWARITTWRHRASSTFPERRSSTAEIWSPGGRSATSSIADPSFVSATADPRPASTPAPSGTTTAASGSSRPT